MTPGSLFGLAGYYRGKGGIWMEALRSWMLPALGGSAALKYLGLTVTHSVLVVVGIAVIYETGSIAIGMFEHRSGATEEQYRQSALSDPYKRETLELLREQTALLRKLAGVTTDESRDQ